MENRVDPNSDSDFNYTAWFSMVGSLLDCKQTLESPEDPGTDFNYTAWFSQVLSLLAHQPTIASTEILLKFPSEVLLDIIEYLNLDEIIAFRNTCRAFQKVADRLLIAHFNRSLEGSRTDDFRVGGLKNLWYKAPLVDYVTRRLEDRSVRFPNGITVYFRCNNAETVAPNTPLMPAGDDSFRVHRIVDDLEINHHIGSPWDPPSIVFKKGTLLRKIFSEDYLDSKLKKISLFDPPVSGRYIKCGLHWRMKNPIGWKPKRGENNELVMLKKHLSSLRVRKMHTYPTSEKAVIAVNRLLRLLDPSAEGVWNSAKANEWTNLDERVRRNWPRMVQGLIGMWI